MPPPASGTSRRTSSLQIPNTSSQHLPNGMRVLHHDCESPPTFSQPRRPHPSPFPISPLPPLHKKPPLTTNWSPALTSITYRTTPPQRRTMYPAFSHPVSLPRSAGPLRRVDRLLNSTAPVMKARRPGTRSYNYCFRYGTLFSRSGYNSNSPSIVPPRTQENGLDDTTKTPEAPAQALGSVSLPNSQAVASNGAPVFRSAPSDATSRMTALRRPAASRAKDEDDSRSLYYRIPFFGTIKVPGSLVLMFVPFLWSSYSIVIKWLYRLPWSLNPVLFNFLRLIVCSIMVLPTFTKKTVTMPIIKAGAELGLWTVLANIFQITGLRYTTASRAAFLSQLSTVLVPLIAVAAGLESRLAASIIISAPLSVLGVALLTLDGAAPSPVGDSIMICVAFIAASYILRSKRYSQLPTKTLVASKTIFQTLFAGIFYVLTSRQPLSLVGATPLWLAVNAGLVIWCGFFIGYVSTILQMSGQTVVSASETAVIFTTSPLWAALLAIPLGERFGPKGFAGASLILVATAFASGIGFRVKPRKKAGELA